MNDKWIISQKWSDVLFLSYKIDPELINETLPQGLVADTYQNDAFVSIIPFYMSKIRFPFTPNIPFSSLWELNLRTYVKFDGVPGIYFYTLDTNHRLGKFIATEFFHLPYRVRKMKGNIKGKDYQFTANDSLKISVIIGEDIKKNELDNWLVERYHLFTNKKNKIFKGTVIHDPWKLRMGIASRIEDQFSSEFNFNLKNNQPIVRYSETLDVRFKPFKRVK